MSDGYPSKCLKEKHTKLVGTAGFEPATPCTPSKCATRLRYVPIVAAVADDGAGLTQEFYTSRDTATRTGTR